MRPSVIFGSVTGFAGFVASSGSVPKTARARSRSASCPGAAPGPAAPRGAAGAAGAFSREHASARAAMQVHAIVLIVPPGRLGSEALGEHRVLACGASVQELALLGVGEDVEGARLDRAHDAVRHLL